MNVGQYRTLLGDLELKKAEVLQVHDNAAFGYAKVVLANARDKVQVEINDLLSIELIPTPVVIGLSAAPASPFNLIVGEDTQSIVTAKMSDGATKDLSKAKYSYATFKDYSTVFNNIGMLTFVDVSAFKPAVDTIYRIVKTAVGWNVYDGVTDGLTVVADSPADTYKIVDIDGEDIGVAFETDGLEVKGDNWSINVTVALTGTTYTTSDESIFSVSEDGKVFALAVGSATLTIANNGHAVTVQVTVA